MPKNAQTAAQLTFISHARKVMLKILQSRLQQHVNHELSDVQAGFRKSRGTRDQIANICWIMEKVREFQKNIYFCFIDYAIAFDCVDHIKLWKILFFFLILIFVYNTVLVLPYIDMNQPRVIHEFPILNPHGKFLKRWEYQTTWPASREICMQVKKQQLELGIEQQTGSIWGRSPSRLYIVTLLI